MGLDIQDGGRKRRTKTEMAAIREAIYRVLADDHPMTVRQVFYRLVSLGTIRKTETEYKATVNRLLTAMRRAGEIPFGWIADNTRWMRKLRTWSGLSAMLEATAKTYRRAIWDEQSAYVEVWLEKDALAGVLYEETELWDVPLMVTRGYPSLSYLYEAAETIAAQSRPAYLYYLGDYDPSGIDITRTVEQGIREFAPSAEIYFERVAVTSEQISLWNLPTRPTKASDTRSKHFQGESVEVDAIPPRVLRELVKGCIIRHVDSWVLQQTLAIEAEERRALDSVMSGLLMDE
jgi:hypothetical protein